MKWIYICILGSFLTGCLESGVSYTHVNDNTYLNYLGSSTFSHLTNEPYRIVGITPGKKHQWDIIVEYAGGCEEHEFSLVWSEEWTGTAPLQSSFYLFHNSHGDACEANIRDTIHVDLNRVFKDTYPEEGAIVKVINAHNKRAITIHPALAAITQSDDCVLELSLENSLCGEGVWKNNWFRVLDSLSGYTSTVWLQPVRNNNNVSLDIPKNKNYKVGVTLLFGYRYQYEDASCLAFPEGTVIPVAINCISGN